MKKISLIGSTGSIGRQVAEVVLNHPDEYKIVAMAAGSNRDLFLKQCALFSPDIAYLASSDKKGALSVAAYDKADIVFNAATGFAGLEYSLQALKCGKTLALANKETLICGGELVSEQAKEHGAEIIPVDSEHSAIWQCLNFNRHAPLRRLIITASGGAFRGRPFEDLNSVTPSQALAHPTWKMGKKITVDSATLVNKGYEVIEARHLFGVEYEDICAVIQPQSVVHSLVEFSDGACLAQLSTPTMEVPIQLALSYPERLKTKTNALDFTKPFSLDFQPIKGGDYPCFDLTVFCGKQGGSLPCVLNAADEVAVQAFISGKIRFTEILSVLEKTVKSVNIPVNDIKDLYKADAAARDAANKIIGL